MKFRSNVVQGITVYDVENLGTPGFRWTELTNTYVNDGDVIDVDFDVVIESYFTSDYLKGNYTPIDDEAKAWAEPLAELTHA